MKYYESDLNSIFTIGISGLEILFYLSRGDTDKYFKSKLVIII